MAKEGHHHVRVYEGSVVSDEGFGDIGHDAGVIAGEALSPEHLHIEPGPGALRGEVQGQQEVPGSGFTGNRK